MRETATQPRQRPWWLVVSLSLLLGALLLLAGYCLVLPSEDAPRLRDRKPLLVSAASTLAPGVDILGGLSPSAAYVVRTSEGLVLVDSGLQADASRLKSQMAELGLDWHGVRAILLTHAHGDHVGGAQHLREMTGAKVYAGAGDAAVLRAGGPREAFFSIFHMPDDTPHPTTVDVELRGGESLAFGAVTFRALAAPGHTPGSICYLMEKAGLRALFAGDVISHLFDRRDSRGEAGSPLGTYSTYLAPRYRGNANDYLKSLQRLRALPVPDLVLPGHPSDDPTPQSPGLSQQRWNTMLDDGIREMETLVSRYQTDGPDFLDGVPKQLLPDLYYLGDFGGTAVYGVFAASRFFLVGAGGQPGLVEFVKTRLRQLGREPVDPTAVLLTSGGPDVRPGLKEIVEQCRAQVVAAPAALDSLKDSCPAGTVLLSAAELPGRGWFTVTPIPLGRRGVAPMAYRVEWAGKSVLFSGRLPLKITPRTVAELAADVGESRTDWRDYVASLSDIRGIKPDLWLPATPVDGQNANLYGREWQRVIDENIDVAKFILSRARLD